MLGTGDVWYFLFNFFLYGFIGWIIENVYCYFVTGHVQEDGFLNGPFKPMYAIAMSVLIFIQETLTLSVLPLILVCVLLPTMVEYLSGLLTRHVFRKDYWDYSELKFNVQGLICLQFSICWTFLTYIGVSYVQPILIKPIYVVISSHWFVIYPFMIIIFLLDEGLTLRTFYLKHVKIKRQIKQEDDLNAGGESYL